MEKGPLKCLFVSSEVAPYAKTGGLADVIGALPKKLREQGVDARVVMPYYSRIRNQFFEHESHFLVSYDVYLGWRVQGIGVYYDDTILPTYFLKSDTYFSRPELYGYQDDYERFAFFCKGVLEMLRHIDFMPDIIHCNDWQTGPLCLLLKDMYSRDSFFSKIKTVYTIHNMKYQGLFGREALNVLDLNSDYMTPEKIEYHGAVSYMKAGLLYSDKITTVSPTYAEEIKTYEYGCGLDRLLGEKLYYKIHGILNGIDYDIYNPQTDTNIYKNYTWRSVKRKKENKKLFQREYGLEESDCMLIGVVSRITDQKGQLIAMRYGTVPIVRKTGGLKDTVTHYNKETREGTGFEFEECSGYWMYKKVEEAYNYYNDYPEDFKKMQLNGMKKGFSWDDAARKYITLYQSMI